MFDFNELPSCIEAHLSQQQFGLLPPAFHPNQIYGAALTQTSASADLSPFGAITYAVVGRGNNNYDEEPQHHSIAIAYPPHPEVSGGNSYYDEGSDTPASMMLSFTRGSPAMINPSLSAGYRQSSTRSPPQSDRPRGPYGMSAVTPEPLYLMPKSSPPHHQQQQDDDGETHEDDDMSGSVIYAESSPDDESPVPIAPIGTKSSSPDGESPVHITEELVSLRKAGLQYKTIKTILNLRAPVSTLRGRFRTLTKPKAQRVRKPVWTPADVSIPHQP
jgi:hypothetical protein